MPKSRMPSAIRAISMHAAVPRNSSVTLVRVMPAPSCSGRREYDRKIGETMCMARRKAALPSMVLTPRPSLAEFRAAPFVVNALEQDIRYRPQNCEDEADANGRQPEVSVDRERQDGEAEIRQHRHHAETREDAGIEEKRIRPEAGQVRRHDDEVQRCDEHDPDGDASEPVGGAQAGDEN